MRKVIVIVASVSAIGVCLPILASAQGLGSAGSSGAVPAPTVTVTPPLVTTTNTVTRTEMVPTTITSMVTTTLSNTVTTTVPTTVTTTVPTTVIEVVPEVGPYAPMVTGGVEAVDYDAQATLTFHFYPDESVERYEFQWSVSGTGRWNTVVGPKFTFNEWGLVDYSSLTASNLPLYEKIDLRGRYVLTDGTPSVWAELPAQDPVERTTRPKAPAPELVGVSSERAVQIRQSADPSIECGGSPDCDDAVYEVQIASQPNFVDSRTVFFSPGSDSGDGIYRVDTIADFAPGEVRYYRVRATDKWGNVSPWSTPIEASN